MDPKSQTRLDRMRRYYPEETIVVIDATWFRSATKTIASLLPHWERKGRSR